MAKLTKKQKQEVEKEVEKKLHKRLYSRAGGFGREVKKQTSVAITAAFGFLIGLSWREPISEAINSLIQRLGLGNALLFKFVSALIITVIAVLFLVVITKWTDKV